MFIMVLVNAVKNVTFGCKNEGNSCVNWQMEQVKHLLCMLLWGY